MLSLGVVPEARQKNTRKVYKGWVSMYYYKVDTMNTNKKIAGQGKNMTNPTDNNDMEVTH